jgi:hypothetical protein
VKDRKHPVRAALDLRLNIFAIDLVTESFAKMRDRLKAAGLAPPFVDVVWPVTGGGVAGRLVRVRLEEVNEEGEVL